MKPPQGWFHCLWRWRELWNTSLYFTLRAAQKTRIKIRSWRIFEPGTAILLRASCPAPYGSPSFLRCSN